MDETNGELDAALVVDGNAVAGLLQEVFASEMTVPLTECAGCGREDQVGGLMAFTRGPGVVIRCPACRAVMVRMTETPSAVYLDARGVTYLRLAR
jgi:Family of unknown function (DUF6510)